MYGYVRGQVGSGFRMHLGCWDSLDWCFVCSLLIMAGRLGVGRWGSSVWVICTQDAPSSHQPQQEVEVR